MPPVQMPQCQYLCPDGDWECFEGTSPRPGALYVLSLRRGLLSGGAGWGPAMVGVTVAVSGVRNGLVVLSFFWGMVSQSPA